LPCLCQFSVGFIFIRHTRECGYPVSVAAERWIPAFAGMTTVDTGWIPAFAGMTTVDTGWIPAFAGMTTVDTAGFSHPRE
jgi:Trk-type K+ transport system membrane component